jgi:polyhydroxybutyrate depolymerase
MNQIIKLTFILSLICVGFGRVVGQSPQTVTRQWTVDGITREAMVYVPATAKSNLTPVIFLFHGHGGNMKEILDKHTFTSLWPEAIVVSPQGLKTPGQLVDREGNFPGWQQAPGDQNDRDIHFFDEMLHTLTTDYKIDKKRIYATGHSNGGSFTYLLWAMRSDDLAAVAPSAAVAFRFNDKLIPKPVMHIMGEKDSLVKTAWQKKQLDWLFKLNKCSTQGQPFGKFALLYPSSLNKPVVVYTHPGGHVYPADADAEVVKFFKDNPHQ